MQPTAMLCSYGSYAVTANSRPGVVSIGRSHVVGPAIESQMRWPESYSLIFIWQKHPKSLLVNKEAI